MKPPEWIPAVPGLFAAVLALFVAGAGRLSRAEIAINPMGVWPGFGYQRYAASVEVSGNYAYVGHNSDLSSGRLGSLSVVDISDPGSPRWVGEYPVAGGIGPKWVTLAGRHLHGLSEGGAFMVLDPANPLAPELVGSLSLNCAPHALAARPSGAGFHTHIAAGLLGLMIVEVVEPSRPRLVGTLQVGDMRAVAVTASHAFVGSASGRLEVIETLDPSHPASVGSLLLSGPITSVRVRGHHALVTDRTGGLSLVDASDPARPAVVWRDDRPGRAMDAAFGTGDLAAYVVDGIETGTSELRLLDLSDFSRPLRAGTGSWSRQPFALALAGNRAYVAEEIYMGPSGLLVFELDLPVSPEPPRIVSEPLDQAVTPGGTASLAALVQGTPPIRFQWYRPDAANIWSKVAGATNSWIVRSPVTAADLGSWRLFATNLAGAVASRVAVIELLAPVSTTHVRVDNPTPRAPFSSWESAATNLQDAVDFTLPGGTILASNGVYRTGATRSNGLNRVVLGQPVLLRSVGGPEVTIIEGQSQWGPQQEGVRCVLVGDGATVSGFTLTNGWTEWWGGGGAWCEPAGMLTNCIISGNATRGRQGSGGGVYGGLLTRCTLVGNRALEGGGVSHSHLSECRLEGNTAIGLGSGGGAADAILTGCTLLGNVAMRGGGVLDSSLTNCTLEGNAAITGGGAAGSLLVHCRLFGNSACDIPGQQADFHVGGGAFASRLYGCILIGNRADDLGGQGGGVGGSSELFECTATANFASVRAGGVIGSRLVNSIVHGNSAPAEPNHATSSFEFSCSTPAPPGRGNIDADPRWLNPGGRDVRLRPDSPCRDSGTNRPGLPVTEIGGTRRILDGDGDGVCSVDLGALEFDPSIPCFTRIQQLPAGIRLEWIPAVPDAILQRASSADSKDWQAISGTGVSNSVIVPATDPAGFFRLLRR